MEPLRQFVEQHIREDCRDLSGTHDNELFYECTFDKLNDLSLINCDLNQSRFKTSSIKDALGFALTLECMSFKNVEYSPLLFDLLLCLMAISKGNDEKRRKVVEILGAEKFAAYQRVLVALE